MDRSVDLEPPKIFSPSTTRLYERTPKNELIRSSPRRHRVMLFPLVLGLALVERASSRGKPMSQCGCAVARAVPGAAATCSRHNCALLYRKSSSSWAHEKLVISTVHKSGSRAGGATAFYEATEDLPRLMQRARWRCEDQLRIYVQEVAPSEFLVRLEPHARARLAQLNPVSAIKVASTNRFVRYRYEAAMASIQGMCRRCVRL